MVTAATPSTASRNAGCPPAWANSGTENRMMPYAPVFKSRPARTTLPAVGACVCASGSHVWNGKAGSFTRKAERKPACIRSARDGASGVAKSAW